MGRVSVKADKNMYQLCREECGMTRQQASEAAQWISDSRIEKIENEKSVPAPEEILTLSRVYRTPELCSYYCSHECGIGKEYVPEVQAKPIEKIVLEMLAALNNLEKEKDRLIEITSDGVIHDDEIEDFVAISNQLKKISETSGALRVWLDKTVYSGGINTGILKKALGKKDE